MAFNFFLRGSILPLGIPCFRSRQFLPISRFSSTAFGDIVRIMESDYSAQQSSNVPDGFPFQIVDGCGDNLLFLVRHFEDEIIKARVELPCDGELTIYHCPRGWFRVYLLRDVYDDMMLDGVHPTRDTFNSLIVGTMRGARLQDAFFFRDEMGKMGLVPDNSDHVVKILEEIKKYDVKPNGQTYVCLLNACATTANLDQVYAIIRDMTEAGAGLNNFCYAELITAYMNKRPVPNDAAMKIIEFVEQSRGWFRVYLLRDVYDDMMLDGVHPTQDTFNSLIVGTMRGAHLQDAFFFRDEMGKIGLVPDVNSYNFLISTCGMPEF